MLAAAIACAGRPARAAAPKRDGDRWAVLVGVDDYALAGKLQYCGADQRALRGKLIEAGFPERQVFLIDDAATENRYRPSKGNIERQIDSVLRTAAEGDVVVLGFSGHGTEIDRRMYLVPGDGDPADPKSLVSLDRIYEQLRGCPASMKLVIVDACRNDMQRGARAAGVGAGARALAATLEKRKLPEGVVLLNSCAPGEISWEEERFGHGVFMHYLLEGLDGKAEADGDGAVSLDELAKYAARETKAFVLNEKSVTQKPYMRNEGEADLLDFKLVPVAAGKRVRDQAIAAWHGLGRPVDRVLANRLFRDAAGQGDPVACTYLGNGLAWGAGDAQQGQWLESDAWYERSLPGVKRLAEAGDPAGLVAFGGLLRRGRECSRDDDKALELYRRAAAQDYVPGILALAELMATRALSASDSRELVKVLERASSMGSPEADTLLGDCYLAGTHVAKDVPRAMECYERAIRERYDNAFGRMAGLLMRGEVGVRENEPRAFQLLLEAHRINPYCGCNHASKIASCYLAGKGVAKDIAMGLEFAELAAKADPRGQTSLGRLLFDGEFVPRDEAKAQDLFRRAREGFVAQAERGTDDAFVWVAMLYGRGLGVAENHQIARTWLQKAKNSGNPAVIKNAEEWIEILDKLPRK